MPGRELALALDGCPDPGGGGGSWPFGGGKAVPDLGDDASRLGLTAPLATMLAGAARSAAPAELLDVRAPYVAELAGVRAAPLGWYACGRRESWTAFEGRCSGGGMRWADLPLLVRRTICAWVTTAPPRPALPGPLIPDASE